MRRSNIDFDRQLSIQELENDFWKELKIPTYPLVEKCYRYRKIPVIELNIEQIRLLIGQDIGIKFLLPIALEILEKNILAEGDYYEGDLLINVLTIKKEYWHDNQQLFQKMKSIVYSNTEYIKNTEDLFDKNKILQSTDFFLLNN